LNTKVLGRIGELNAIETFLSYNIPVYEPTIDVYEVDFIAEINGEFKKFQVKTTQNIKDGKMSFDFRKTIKNGHKQYENIDYYIIYCIENSYLGILDFKSTGDYISIRFVKPKNNQVKGINWHQDYELNKYLKSL